MDIWWQGWQTSSTKGEISDDNQGRQGEHGKRVNDGIRMTQLTCNLFKLKELKELHTLLDLSGHNREDGPRRSDSVLTVMDTDIATWPPSKLREAYSKHDIHIVPARPCDHGCIHNNFNAHICAHLGINVHQSHEVHGKYFESRRNTGML
jgi:hypothetical protein